MFKRSLTFALGHNSQRIIMVLIGEPLLHVLILGALIIELRTILIQIMLLPWMVKIWFISLVLILLKLINVQGLETPKLKVQMELIRLVDKGVLNTLMIWGGGMINRDNTWLSLNFTICLLWCLHCWTLFYTFLYLLISCFYWNLWDPQDLIMICWLKVHLVIRLCLIEFIVIVPSRFKILSSLLSLLNALHGFWCYYRDGLSL